MRPKTIDSPLLEAAKGSDAGAVETLLILCRPNLRRYAERQCAASSDVEDAVQESLIIVYRQVSTLRVAGAFTGWLFQIVRRECLRLARRSFRFGDPLATANAERLLAKSSDVELRLDLALAIQSLPDLYREVIILRDFEELTIQEIAARLEMLPETVKTRIYRGRHLIREHLLA